MSYFLEDNDYQIEYYRIILNSDDFVTVREMVPDDEYDMDQHLIFEDEDGDKLRFDREEDAILWLNENVRADKIDPKYVRPNLKDYLISRDDS